MFTNLETNAYELLHAQRQDAIDIYNSQSDLKKPSNIQTEQHSASNILIVSESTVNEHYCSPIKRQEETREKELTTSPETYDKIVIDKTRCDVSTVSSVNYEKQTASMESNTSKVKTDYVSLPTILCSKSLHVYSGIYSEIDDSNSGENISSTEQPRTILTFDLHEEIDCKNRRRQQSSHLTNCETSYQLGFNCNTNVFSR